MSLKSTEYETKPKVIKLIKVKLHNDAASLLVLYCIKHENSDISFPKFCFQDFLDELYFLM